MRVFDPSHIAATLLLASESGCAQSASPPPAAQPTRIPAPGGEVILPSVHDRMAYERGGYAALRRSGDLLFLSGVIVARRPGEGTDVNARVRFVVRLRALGSLLARQARTSTTW